jgi:hypothetical protein
MHLPLNFALLAYVFIHSPRFVPPVKNISRWTQPSLDFERYLFFFCLFSEIFSFSSQGLFAYNFLIIKGFNYLENISNLAKVFAAFLYVIIMFLVNDGPIILTIIYINRFIESLTGTRLMVSNSPPISNIPQESAVPR